MKPLYAMALASMLAPISMADDKVAAVDNEVVIMGQIVPNDVLDKRRRFPCKIHTLKLSKDKTYVIDLLSMAFDPYLRVEDSKGNNLAEDDDSGGNLQSRLVFRAPADDTYQLIATSYSGGAGMYTLQVRPTDGAKVLQPKTAPKK